MSFNAPPHDLLLDVRNWLGDPSYPHGGIYPHFLHEDFDPLAAAVWVDGVYVELWQTMGPENDPLAKHQAIKDEIFRRIEAQKRVRDAANQPAPAPTPVGLPIRGVLRLVDGGRGGLADDLGRRIFTGCHAGDLLSRFYRYPDAVRAHLDTISAAGCQFVRTWTILDGPWWAERTGEIHPEMPGYWQAVHFFARELVTRGLRWLVSQGDAMRHYQGDGQRRFFMRNLGLTLGEEGGIERLVIGVDGGNEAWQIGEPDPDRLATALAAFLEVLPVPIASLTSCADEGELNRYARTPSTVIDYHLSRMPFRHAIERCFTASYWDGKLLPFLVSSEPPGGGPHVSATNHPEEWLDLEVTGTLALVHYLTKQLYVHMSSPGVISDEPFDRYPALAQGPKLAAMLPADIQSWRAFHGGEGRASSPERILAAPPGNFRCDHVKAPDGRIACLVYVDEPCHLDLFAVNGFEGDVIHPGTLERVPFQFTQGQRVPVDLRRGRLFLGRTR